MFVKLQEQGVSPYLISILQFWSSYQTMKARWSKSISAPILLTSGVQRILSCVYMDDLSEKLKECKTGNYGVG